MEEALNDSGDVLIPTTGIHGASISEQREDALDRACRRYVGLLRSRDASVNVADLGGGPGAQSKKLAALGANVWLFDLTDQAQRIQDFNEQLGRNAITFVHGDLRGVRNGEVPAQLNCLYSQRMLDCIPFNSARTILTNFSARLRHDAGVFLSAAGLNSELGRNYLHRDFPVERRYTVLADDMARKHGLFAAECLYTEGDMARLMAESGLRPREIWSSPFGNIKAIGYKP
ncbi:MAG: class I SAM-dependent methyltransferase [Alphaproteobacteria bacterium]|nr:class I SAM-dependent methyltransferase [Alphaproteobacteria bacterium]